MAWKNPFHYTKEEKELSDAYIRRHKTIKHLLTPHQKQIYDMIFNSDKTEIGMYCSRKVGKTAGLLLMQHEFAWRNADCLIRFVLADQTQATNIIEPMINSFLRRLIPGDMMPKYLKSERAFRFDNGSIIKLNGANPDAIERAVGPTCHFFVFDEIAIWDGDVKHALLDVFYPQGTLTNAKKVYSCTPPPEVDSYYLQYIHPKLLSKNSIVTLTIYDNPLLTSKQVEEIEEEMGGKDSPEFQRQYLCKVIPNNSRRVTPEFNKESHVYEERLKSIEYGNQQVPQQYYYYLSVDTGTVDNSAFLIGYLDHHSQQLVIEEEFISNAMNITEISNKIQEIIEKYRPYFFEESERYLKVIIDAFSLEKKELREIHGITHVNPSKKKVEDNIAHLRSAFANDKIQISNKCERLQWELENCIWKLSANENKQIERTVQQKHGDAIMALTYMLRAVNWRFRPGQIEYNISLIEHNPHKNNFEELKKRTPQIWTDLR